MTGSGNDFVMLDGRSTTPEQWPAARIRDVCDRRNRRWRGWTRDPDTGHRRSPHVLLELGRVSRRDVRQRCALQRPALSTSGVGSEPANSALFTDAGVVRVASSAGEDTAEISLPDFDLPCQAHGPRAGRRASVGSIWGLSAYLIWSFGSRMSRGSMSLGVGGSCGTIPTLGRSGPTSTSSAGP